MVTCMTHVSETFINENIIEQEIPTSNFDNFDNEPPCFVAVHIGAGYHSASKTGAYRNLCEKICFDVMGFLKQGYSARTACATAVALLENSPLTNAGIGSNLTLDEKVECDASIMDKNGFGSVGAISNIKNPIMVSLSLLEAQIKGTLSLGRIVPCMLVGEGAKKWAIENNLEEVDDNYLKTEAMIKTHKHYKQKLDSFHQDENSFIQNECDEKKREDETQRLDTVGAVCLDKNGNFASAASSGGILLKHPGRVGHASMFGCGCWVDQDIESNQKENNSIGICTTGCGEYIIKTLFAKECSQHILKNLDKIDYDLNEFFKKKFFGSPLLKKVQDKLIGTLICKLSTYEKNHLTEKTLELIVAHTTPSMCFGYMSSNMHKPTSVMSRMNESNTGSESVLITNFNFNLSPINWDGDNSNLEKSENIDVDVYSGVKRTRTD
ncbi:unnamed protein product [Brachionus calyciflorus]|uniref:Uncharacterized protein n=1 Tax=Brachionus calyciflorus TaxID=104777 RepID=A0A813MAV3_9BILA|nr:unnamed protein product [Brachionus calyciflorus]